MKLHPGLFFVIIITAVMYQSSAQVGFAPASQYGVIVNSVYVGPYCVQAADVNGDGKLDLICANHVDAGSLTVFTNNGSGGFGLSVSYNNLGNYPQYVVAADLNGDGKVDLASVAEPNTLTVLTNDGSGVFAVSATMGVGLVPYCVVAADINGDGRLDLITGNVGDDSVTVLTNSGAGVFGVSAKMVLAEGFGPSGMATADVNGDGKVDLICASPSIGLLTVFTNNGFGGFGSNAIYYAGTAPYSVAAADINGDGKVDLISADSGSGTLTVLTNNGTGVFGLYATLDAGGGPQSVAVADMNGDGKPDLISANFSGNALTVFTNNGSGFGFDETIQAEDCEPAFVTTADVNGDGKPDIIFADYFANALSVMTNTTIFPPPVSMPLLSIGATRVGTRVWWPSPSAGWSLEQNSDLTMPDWEQSGYSGWSIVDDGTNKSITIPSSAGSLFFRLMHP